MLSFEKLKFQGLYFGFFFLRTSYDFSELLPFVSLPVGIVVAVLSHNSAVSCSFMTMINVLCDESEPQLAN